MLSYSLLRHDPLLYPRLSRPSDVSFDIGTGDSQMRLIQHRHGTRGLVDLSAEASDRAIIITGA